MPSLLRLATPVADVDLANDAIFVKEVPQHPHEAKSLVWCLEMVIVMMECLILALALDCKPV